jgi:hypothetical protein
MMLFERHRTLLACRRQTATKFVLLLKLKPHDSEYGNNRLVSQPAPNSTVDTPT